MKAIYIERCGGPEVLRYGDLPDPEPAIGQLVVDIYAASINAADWKSRRGESAAIPRFPHVLGRDFSGVVSALGEGVHGFKVGDAVFGVCQVGEEGAYAENIAVDADIVAPKPAAISHLEAAAAALAGLTALVAVEETLELQPHESILIQGGAGGVAGFAVQLARRLGAYVITTASSANVEYVRELGADQVIDYTVEDFTQVVADCDAVFDTVGGDVASRSFEVLKPGGRAAFIASGPEAPTPVRGDVSSLRPRVHRARRSLERLVQLIQSRAVSIPPIRRYPLHEAALAHEVSESRHLRGKLVLQVR